jgi:hypothetical protein
MARKGQRFGHNIYRNIMNGNEIRIANLRIAGAANAAAEFDILGNAFGFGCPTYLAGALGIYNECHNYDTVLLSALTQRLPAPSGLIPVTRIDFTVSRSRPSVFALSALYLNEVGAEPRADADLRAAIYNRIFADHLNNDEKGNPAIDNLGETVRCDGTSWIRIYWMAAMRAAAGNPDVKAPALSVAVLGYLLALRCLESIPGGAQTDPEAARKALESVLNDLHAPPNGSRLRPGDLKNALEFLFQQDAE